MFTGLIETTAKISDYKETKEGAVICVICPQFTDEIKLGDSISVNGACLTVIKINGDAFDFEVSKESLKMTTFQSLKKGDIVNLERAMKADARFDGHIVSGHIDGTAKIISINEDGFSYCFEFLADKEVMKYVVKKGSIAINGISLTVADVKNDNFRVEIIPHTFKNTNLNLCKIGDTVNIETDILARYVEKFLSLDNNSSNISMKMLKENGYF